jgi:hypothetical protein
MRWIHLPQHDPGVSWISFVKARSGDVFFVALEGERFFKKQFPSSKGYHMLLYSSPSQKIRHMIFKGKRLLLTRASEREEDIKSSLHFLSRTHADIHETLEVLKCDYRDLISFIVSQKKASIPLSYVMSSHCLGQEGEWGLFLVSFYGQVLRSMKGCV